MYLHLRLHLCFRFWSVTASPEAPWTTPLALGVRVGVTHVMLAGAATSVLQAPAAATPTACTSVSSLPSLSLNEE